MPPTDPTPPELLAEVQRLRARNAWLEAQLSDVDRMLERFIGRPGTPSSLPEQRRKRQVQAATEERDSAQAAMAVKVAELARAHAELRQLDQMKQNFLSLISHELRTPISVIVGYAGILADDVGAVSPPEQREFLRKIMDEADKLLSLVNNILDMNRLLTGELTLDHREVSFAEIVQNVVEQFLPAAEGKGVRLDVEAPDALPLLCSDEQRLGQVLRNLVDNAIKFTPAGGVVRVHAETQEGTLLCEVEDTGIGIEHEDAVRLFQVFGQLDPSATRLRGGLGLGLALVRELVTLMGGEVGVRSTVREGSTFWFKLPLRHAPPTDAAVEIRKHVY
jgi:signal transduction histidine kinase